MRNLERSPADIENAGEKGVIKDLERGTGIIRTQSTILENEEETDNNSE